MPKQLLTNKFLLIGLGIIALIGLVFISYNAAKNASSPPVPSSQSFQPKTATLPPPQKDHPISGQLIVKFKPQYTNAQINAHLLQYNASVIKTIEGINQTVIKVPAGQEAAIMQQLKSDPYVETAQRDYTTHAFFAPNDPEFSLQYAFKNNGQAIQGKAGSANADIKAESAWDVTKGNGVKVAILDTGINLNHPDLSGKVILQKSFVSTTVEDGNGHGTHVAGIIAADTNNGTGVAGTCPECQLLIGKVLDDNGEGTTSNSTAGITWAADNGAKVINMSLGTTDANTSSLYAQAVNYALSKGAIVVAAAGNDGNSQLNWPAATTGVISVAATTNKDQKPSYSNFGSYVQIAAPGDNILSTAPTHSFQLAPFGYSTSVPYMYLSGTSMATPYVSGVAALVASTSFGTSPQAITNRLYSTADKINGTGTYWTHGRINAAAAVGPEPTAKLSAQPTEITPTLFCVGGNGTPPCATIGPSGSPVVPSISGTSPSIAQSSPGPSGVNPSTEPGISTSPVPSGTNAAPGGSNPNGTPCFNVFAIFYNLNPTQQSSVSTMSREKHHNKGRGHHRGGGNSGNGNGNGGNGGGNNGNGFISQFFQFLLRLLQLLLQQIFQCNASPGSQAPSPSQAPSQAPVSGVPSVSTTVPSVQNPSPTSGSKPTATPKPAQPTPTTPVTSSTCTNPTHTLPMNTSDPQDGFTLDKYYITNDTWNASGFNITQTMYICNYNNWYVVAGNMSEPGGVKSYPNVHEDFNNNPQISSFKTITSTFASTSPPQNDIYDAAYDIWINNQAIEVMIWNNSWNKGDRLTPGGSKQTTVTFGGRSYDVYKSGGYIAFVATTPFDSGTLDLLQIFKWITSQGWIASNSTLSQIDYGIELISTNNQNATFKVTNFSITTN